MSLSFSLLFFSVLFFCFSFFLTVFPFWFSISLTSNSFPSFSSYYGFYINHAIVTPLYPFGLLVSKKDYIYPCSRYANNPYTLVAHCFLFSFFFLFPSLSLFFSDPLLLYHLSSPFLSSLSLFLLLGLPVSFSVMLISSFLPYISSLFSPCFFFLFCSSRTRIAYEREHNLCSWIISLSLFIFLTIIFFHHRHYHGPVQLFFSFFPPSPASASPFLPLVSLYPFYPFISLSQPS